MASTRSVVIKLADITTGDLDNTSGEIFLQRIGSGGGVTTDDSIIARQRIPFTTNSSGEATVQLIPNSQFRAPTRYVLSIDGRGWPFVLPDQPGTGPDPGFELASSIRGDVAVPWIISTTAPSSPTLNAVWLDNSDINAPVFKVWNGTDWAATSSTGPTGSALTPDEQIELGKVGRSVDANSFDRASGDDEITFSDNDGNSKIFPDIGSSVFENGALKGTAYEVNEYDYKNLGVTVVGRKATIEATDYQPQLDDLDTRVDETEEFEAALRRKTAIITNFFVTATDRNTAYNVTGAAKAATMADGDHQIGFTIVPAGEDPIVGSFKLSALLALAKVTGDGNAIGDTNAVRIVIGDDSYYFGLDTQGDWFFGSSEAGIRYSISLTDERIDTTPFLHGVIDQDHLGTGADKSGTTKYLREDGTFSAPASAVPTTPSSARGRLVGQTSALPTATTARGTNYGPYPGLGQPYAFDFTTTVAGYAGVSGNAGSNSFIRARLIPPLSPTATNVIGFQVRSKVGTEYRHSINKLWGPGSLTTETADDDDDISILVFSGGGVGSGDQRVQVRYGINSSGYSYFELFGDGTDLPANSTVEVYELVVSVGAKGDKGDKGDPGASGTSFAGLSDTPATLGTAEQRIKVNAAGSALEFYDEMAAGASSEVATVATLPTAVGKDIGTLINFNGELYEVVAGTTDPHIHRFIVADLGSNTQGDTIFQWQHVDPFNIRAYLPNTVNFPLIMALYRSQEGQYSEVVLSRSPGDTTQAGRNAYHRRPISAAIDQSIVGEQASVEFYQYTDATGRGAAITIQPTTNRWVPDTRNQPIVDPTSLAGNKSRWSKDKLPATVVYSDGAAKATVTTIGKKIADTDAITTTAKGIGGSFDTRDFQWKLDGAPEARGTAATSGAAYDRGYRISFSSSPSAATSVLPPVSPPTNDVDGIWVVAKVNGVETQRSRIPWGPGSIQEQPGSADNRGISESLIFFRGGAVSSGTGAGVLVRYQIEDGTLSIYVLGIGDTLPSGCTIELYESAVQVEGVISGNAVVEDAAVDARIKPFARIGDNTSKAPLANLPIVELTQAQYDALSPPVAGIIYAIPETS